MPSCKRMTEMATDRVEGHLGLLARQAFDRHLARCDGCAAFVRQLDATRRAVGRLPEPEVPPALNEALLAGFDAWAAARPATPPPRPRPAWRFSPWPVAGAAAALGLLVAFARERSQAPGDWMAGAALAAAALALAAVAGRFAMGAAAAGVAAALAAALARAGGGGMEAVTGVDCLVSEIAAAAAVGGLAWLGARRAAPGLAPRFLAGGAVAGALVADAALQTTCGAGGALPHHLVFHAGGVLLVAAAAMAVLAVGRGAARA